MFLPAQLGSVWQEQKMVQEAYKLTPRLLPDVLPCFQEVPTEPLPGHG